ncbi:hypothetical protein [Streptosporangium sp. NPDC001681]|uniref:hypothetical protein n=1 Tax=Streptosporangium sp. NPDC001681 TaxID=3154395 RepID=UPI003331A54F
MALVVIPGVVERTCVDGLPSGQGYGLGEDVGELGAEAGSYRVPVCIFHLGDLGAHLVGDGDPAASAIQQAQVVGLGGEDHDRGGVDGGGGFDPGRQLVGLLLVVVAAVPGGGGEVEWGQAEEHAGVVGQAKAGGDALIDVQVGDLASPSDDQAHVALGYSGRRAETDLACSAVLDSESEKPHRVTVLKNFLAFVAVPDPCRNLDRIESVPMHSILRSSAPKWCIAAERDSIFLVVYLRGIGRKSSPGHSFRHDNTG